MAPRVGLRVATAAGAALLLVAPPVRAQQPESGPWAGTMLTTPAETSEPDIELTGVIHKQGLDPTFSEMEASLSVVDAPAESCAPELAETSTLSKTSATTWDVSRAATFPCNGTYQLRLAALERNRITGGVETSTDAFADLVVAAPGPPVEDLTVGKGDEREVELSWTAPEAPPDGLAGYRIDRKVGDGEYAEVVTLDDAEATSYADTSIPDGGGELTYRVQTLRDSPIGPVASPSTSAEPISFDPLPGPDPTTPDTVAPAVGTGSVEAAARRVAGVLDLPRVGPSRVDLPALSTPTSTDTGFEETLPFDEPEPGEEDPVLPGDELASLTYERDGRGLLVPAAAALVLAVWAAHLRYLARLAKQ